MKKLKLMTIAILGIFILTGCINGNDDNYVLPEEREPGTKAELTLWSIYNDQDYLVFEEIINKFEDENPDIKVNIERIPKGGQWSRITTALAVNETPDIAQFDMEYIPILADRRAIINLNILGADEKVDNFIHPAIGANTHKGNIWAIPDQVNTSVLVYNKDLFDQGEVAYPNSNWSWDDLETAAKTIAGLGTETYGYVLDASFFNNIPIFASFGVDILNLGGGSDVLDSQEAIDALTFVVNLVEDEIAPFSEKDSSGMIEKFKKGNVAMALVNTEALKELNEFDFELGISTVPKGPMGSVSNISGTSMAIFRNSEYPREAYKLLQFLVSNEIQEYWADESGKIPVNKEVFELVDTEKSPHLEVAMEQVNSVKIIPMDLNHGKLYEVMDKNILAALMGDVSPEQAILNAVKEINQDNDILLGN